MDRTEIAATNASMTARVLQMPPTPVPDGGYALRVLRTRGRRSGEPRDTPIGVVGHGGAGYLVSPTGGRDWVRNLRATPECAIRSGTGDEPHRAVEPGRAEAAAVVVGYLRALDVPWALSAFPVPADATEEQVAEHLDTIAVFRLDPA
ncbi:nitroreductase family deazaflavin-dependent oxidoreductase [Pseudonocardia sp. ICBG1034]|uniref:nitroreductase family deazaflavin-dependent oxidoreductase n=1 Tax=Pseudonocardia sp. ICBG1034 TaxID=2844381 RepID=UPI001CC91814|nr:nitroreductase family deazaflavin-dependent oxidoreductase [Pseudonocardia sp. ICBG1034]